MGWGTAFADFDLDGDSDWIIANGHLADDVAQFREPVAGYRQPMLLHENLGDGLFDTVGAEAGEVFAEHLVGRGLAVADIDRDGDLDVLVTQLGGAPVLLRNESDRKPNHWLIVRTKGSKSNRDGIGARVTVTCGDRKLVREVVSGQSFLSQSDLRAHFGVGAATIVDRVEVTWPSRAVSVLENVSVDQVVSLSEP